jgi:5-formyltetrahydrofolate cyclo-ligase
MLKSELRKTYLAKMKLLSQDQLLEKSQQIANLFFDNFSLENVKYLHTFLTITKNCEVETKFIYEKVWRDLPSVKTIVPRVKGDEIESISFNIDSQMSENHWQISEPIDSIFVESTEIDVVIVPLLCVDKYGNRVGYGKGFYDRFLANCREDCLKIGVSFFEPTNESFDKNKNDVRLNFCLTPHSILKF